MKEFRSKVAVITGAVGGMGEESAIAWPIVFLCSEKARWIVGADLNVSAGQVID